MARDHGKIDFNLILLRDFLACLVEAGNIVLVSSVQEHYLKSLKRLSAACIAWNKAFFQENRLLLLIILVSLALRFSGVFWGLPFIKHMRFYHPDESKIVDGAYEFPVHILTNLDLRYPTAFHYTLGVLTLPLRLISYPKDYYAIYLVGRLLSVLAGAATILVTFLLSRKIFHRRIRSSGVFLDRLLHAARRQFRLGDHRRPVLLALVLVPPALAQHA